MKRTEEDRVIILPENKGDILMKINKKGIIKRLIGLMLIGSLAIASFTGCEKKEEEKKTVELTILAAASLTDVCEEIKTNFEKGNENIKLTFSFGSSGALQTQIEEGAPADVFMSAAMKQMDALNDQKLMDSDSIVKLLENKIVLIAPKGNPAGIKSVEDLTGDGVKIVALGDPESVPAGQYAEEVLTSLGILDAVKAKANYGSDVRTVLTWVENGDCEAGIVYATDAYSSDKVEIICTAPEGSCKQVIYPVGITASSDNKDAAGKFVDYLKTDEAIKLFEKYGFSKFE